MAAGLRKTLAALEDPSGGRLVYSYFKCLKISKYEKGNEKLEAPGRDRLWRERGAARHETGDAAGRGETPRVGGPAPSAVRWGLRTRSARFVHSGFLRTKCHRVTDDIRGAWPSGNGSRNVITTRSSEERRRLPLAQGPGRGLGGRGRRPSQERWLSSPSGDRPTPPLRQLLPPRDSNHRAAAAPGAKAAGRPAGSAVRLPRPRAADSAGRPGPARVRPLRVPRPARPPLLPVLVSARGQNTLPA